MCVFHWTTLPVCYHYSMSVTDKRNTSVEHLWNVTGKGKSKYLKKTPSQRHFAWQKYKVAVG